MKKQKGVKKVVKTQLERHSFAQCMKLWRFIRSEFKALAKLIFNAPSKFFRGQQCFTSSTRVTIALVPTQLLFDRLAAAWASKWKNKIVKF